LEGDGSGELKGRDRRAEGQGRTSSDESLFTSWKTVADAGMKNLEGPVVLNFSAREVHGGSSKPVCCYISEGRVEGQVNVTRGRRHPEMGKR
jgi:hypothetical protein